MKHSNKRILVSGEMRVYQCQKCGCTYWMGNNRRLPMWFLNNKKFFNKPECPNKITTTPLKIDSEMFKELSK